MNISSAPILTYKALSAYKKQQHKNEENKACLLSSSSSILNLIIIYYFTEHSVKECVVPACHLLSQNLSLLELGDI